MRAYSWSLYDVIMNTMTGGSAAVTQKRVTTLGASKSDIASMLWRVLEAPADGPVTITSARKECEVREHSEKGRGGVRLRPHARTGGFV